MRRAAVGGLVVVVVLALAAAIGAGLYAHTYGVDVAAAAGTLPERLHTCDRDFDRAGAPRTAQQVATADPGTSTIGTWAPPLRTALTIVGHGDRAACGAVVYLEQGPDELVPYGLVGGP